jgi:hypothetical protein
MPREQTSFVLEFQSLALPPHIAALIGGQLHPLMMLTWRFCFLFFFEKKVLH